MTPLHRTREPSRRGFQGSGGIDDDAVSPRAYDLSREGRADILMVRVIDARTGSIKSRLKAPQDSVGRIKITADGRRAIIDSDSSKDVWVYDVRTKALIGTIKTSAEHKVLTVSADGRRAFLTNPDADSVTVVDIKAGREIGQFKTGHRPDGIAWVE